MDFHAVKVTFPADSSDPPELGIIRNDLPTIELDDEPLQGLFSIQKLEPFRALSRMRLVFKISKLELLYSDDRDREHEPVSAPVAADPSGVAYRDAEVRIVFDQPWEQRNNDTPELIEGSGFDAQLIVNGKALNGVLGFAIRSRPLAQPRLEVELLYSSLETNREQGLPEPEPVSQTNPCPEVTFQTSSEGDVTSITRLEIHDDLQPLRALLVSAQASGGEIGHVKLKFETWTLEFNSSEPMNLPRFKDQQLDLSLLRYAQHATDPSGTRLTKFKLEFYGWSLEITSDQPFGTFEAVQI